MEEIRRLCLSRHGYRAHLTMIIAGSKEITENDPSQPLSEPDITSLSDFLEQLRQKKEILVDLDTRIMALIEEEGDLESEILETEEIQGSISQQVAQINRVLGQHRSTHTVSIVAETTQPHTATPNVETMEPVSPSLSVTNPLQISQLPTHPSCCPVHQLACKTQKK